MNTKLLSSGRIVYALPFGMFGLTHFMNAAQMAGIVPSWIPGGIFWVYVTGLVHLAVCISLIINKYVFPASLILAGMLIVFILTIHAPGLANAQTMQMSIISLLKDTALAGAALGWAGLAGVKKT